MSRHGYRPFLDGPLFLQGIPLQVKHGVNGWLVPPGEPSKTADILFDFFTGKIKLERPTRRSDLGRRRRDSLHTAPSGRHRPSLDTFTPSKMTESPRSDSPDHLPLVHPDKEDVHSKTDPNDIAEDFVNDIGAPYPAVHPDESSPSENFFTVGTSTEIDNGDRKGTNPHVCFFRQCGTVVVDLIPDEWKAH